ncbi:MAG: DNA translocase SftA [Pelotomaculum sp. PtaU1.Bin065]|nr:MAG: DNA translocase SftA [Pelotomaculum sp. PtaU1.Bin065]
MYQSPQQGANKVQGKNSEELSFAELVQNVLIISGLTGMCCLVWLLNPSIQQFLDFIPRDLVVAGVKWGFGIPVIYATGWIAIWKRGVIWDRLTSKLRRDPSSQVPDPGETEVLSLLPAPPAMEYSRTGQGYARQLPAALEHIGITRPGEKVNVLSVTSGPMAAQIVAQLPTGIRLSQLKNATADIQAAMHAPSVSVTQGPKAYTASIVIAYEEKQPVVLRQIISAPEYQNEAKKGKSIVYPVGVSVTGKPLFSDFGRTPHLLVAGTTGSGKSVWINQFLVALQVCYSPTELRLVLIDPKMVEFAPYRDHPHVLAFADNKEAALIALNLLDQESKRRYKLFQQAEVRNITGYRHKTGENLPYIVCVIDEFAELLSGGKDQKDTLADIERIVQSLGQLARASGVHLAVATQKPSIKIISSEIKSNLPGRISFALSGLNAYSVVLDNFPSGTTLLGQGDGMAEIFGLPEIPMRFQGAMVGLSDEVTDRTIKKIREYWLQQNVTPAPVPVFSGKVSCVSRPQAADSEDDAPDTPKTQTSNQRVTGKLPLETMIRKEIAEIAAYAEEDDKVVRKSAEIAKDLQVRRAAVDEILDALASEEWVTGVQGAGRGAKRLVLVEEEEAYDWLTINGFISN